MLVPLFAILTAQERFEVLEHTRIPGTCLLYQLDVTELMQLSQIIFSFVHGLNASYMFAGIDSTRIRIPRGAKVSDGSKTKRGGVMRNRILTPGIISPDAKLKSLKDHLLRVRKISRRMLKEARIEGDNHKAAFVSGTLSEVEWMLDLHFGIKISADDEVS